MKTLALHNVTVEKGLCFITSRIMTGHEHATKGSYFVTLSLQSLLSFFYSTTHTKRNRERNSNLNIDNIIAMLLFSSPSNSPKPDFLYH